ncbi:CAP domain-containing protein [Streptomyces chromofuscus]|uniref:CAP domain-containing protein n=1 Tax=Streptomyces chromofuscus TaxID=42881 RepID=A0A7M2T3N4_STRCW|nr:CAP domain-containing protein [Streptomyces chromofuscus]QOV43287.1 CAP domain-containing protein [Streptomyces chromofuscus]GGT29738.1 membrane protein [Streptomyces chromofuscus]
MGRHRRSDAGRAATGGNETHGSPEGGQVRRDSHADGPVAPGIAPYVDPEAYAEAVSKSHAYLFAPDDRDAPAGDTASSGDTAALSVADGFTPDGGSRHGHSHRRGRKGLTPVRTGLLGVTAAVAVGAVAVATGVLPGGDTYTLGGGAGDVRASETATATQSPQGGTSGTADAGDSSSPSTGRDTERGTSPSASPSTSSAKPTTKAPTTEAPAAKPPAAKPSATKTPTRRPSATPSSQQPAPGPSRTPTKVPTQPSAPTVTISPETAAEAEVLKFVNDERAKGGCRPVAANSALAELAGDYSEAMAEQGFFGHTDPSGRTPWDRAEAAGISNLGGENIARGQADATAVMKAWMDSPGHRTNILNCDFTTLGVGVHYGSGGPWWTQEFGY